MKLCEPESLNKHYMSIYTKKKKKKLYEIIRLK